MEEQTTIIPDIDEMPEDRARLSIDEIVHIISGKLKDDVGVSEEEWLGDDLNLTGMKPEGGGKFDPNGKYMIKVPVWIHVERSEHKRLMRKEFMRTGKSGLRKYLTKYLKGDALDKVMTIV